MRAIVDGNGGKLSRLGDNFLIFGSCCGAFFMGFQLYQNRKITRADNWLRIREFFTKYDLFMKVGVGVAYELNVTKDQIALWNGEGRSLYGVI